MRTTTRTGRTAIAALALATSLAGTAGAALPDRLVVERIGRERGFPSETITAILRDGQGFLWVGSREGLALWDGDDVRVFQHSIGDPASLSDDAVRRIFEDGAGRLWVGSDAGGLQVLDRATWTFRTYRHDPEDPNSLSGDGVYAIADQGPDTLWVGTQDGLDRLDVATGRVRRYTPDSDDPSALPNPWVYDVHVDARGRVWVATVGGGIAWLDPDSGRFTRVSPPPSSSEPSSALMYGIAESDSGEIWFGGEFGVYRHDEARGTLRHVPVAGMRTDGESAIVTDVAFDRFGVLWATSWNGGLFAVDVATGSDRQFRHEPGVEDGLATDRLACLFVDRGQDVWVGSWGGGIHRFHADLGRFSSIVERRGDRPGLPYSEVTSVLEDPSGRLWIGTWGRGLCWRDGGEARFACTQGTSMSTPLSLLADGEGGVWVGSIDGLFRVDRTGRAEPWIFPDDLRRFGSGWYVNALAFDRAGHVWIGTGSAGLVRIEPDGSDVVAQYVHDPEETTSVSDDFVTSLWAATDGALWVGTRSGGLNRLDPGTGRFERFLPDPDDPGSIGHHTVTSLFEDRRGTIWAGTAGGGITRVERAPDGGWALSRTSVDDGLVNASVVSIQQDDDGTLWIATRRGLSRYDPDSGRFHNYGRGDGLPSLEFRPNASCAGVDRLYFGSLGGVLGVDRGTRFEPPASTPTRITSIRTLDGPWVADRPTWEVRDLSAPWGTMLSIEFGVLDLRPPHRFAYRLEGESEDWIDLGTRREITFAGLPPDTYALHVRGLSARGVWSEAPPLTMRILPPFWMTWWFRGLVAVGIVALTWTWIHVRLNALARRNRELEALHHDREAALAQARASEEALHGAYGRLRDLTRRLEDAKEEERRRIARELHDEMGQALSAVKINLKALGRMAAEDDRAIERVADALALVDGIIRQVRALSLDLRPPLLDELGLVAALRGYAESQSIRTGVEIVVESNTDVGGVPAEFAITAFRIVQESIHNVVRHAGAARATVSVRRDPGRLTLAVTDDGRGFDVGAALERAASGRHLGLLGMRERVEALGGRFDVESTPGRGTTVHARIPVDGEEGAP